MKARSLMKKAEAARAKMQDALEPINHQLRELLGDDIAHVFYQSSDGWCILFDDDHNAPLALSDIDSLFNMDRDDALEYLRKRSI